MKRMFRRATRVPAIVAAAVCVLAVVPLVPPAPSASTVRLITAFMPFGEAVLSEYGAALPELRFVIVPEAGSGNNLRFLQNGSADLALAHANVAYRAYGGQLAGATSNGGRLRAIAILYPTVLHLLVRPAASIRTVRDLAGRRVGTGPPESGTAMMSALLLRAFNVAPEGLRRSEMALTDSAEAVIRGDLDAAFFTAPIPVNAIRRASDAGARLVDITGPVVDTLRVKHQFLRRAVIPAHTYASQRRDVMSLRVDVLLVCRQDMDERTVYRLTKTLFDILPRLASRHEFLRAMDMRHASATPIPLHPGAAAYYREQELLR